MYSDVSGHFAISALTLLIGAGIGALIGGAVSGIKAYKEGERGWDLTFDILGGALLGTASGVATTLGGAAGLAAAGVALTGGLTLSTGTALVISMGTMAVGNMFNYGFDFLSSNGGENFRWDSFVYSGINGSVQGLFFLV